MSDTSRSWSDNVADTTRSATDSAHTAAPEIYDRAVRAAAGAGGTIRQYPLSSSMAGALLGYGLAFLVHHQWTAPATVSHGRSRDERSWTNAAADAANLAAGRVRSVASDTYDRAAHAKEPTIGIGQYVLSGSVAAALLGYVLGVWSRR